jgi:CHAD domain-containing protein
MSYQINFQISLKEFTNSLIVELMDSIILDCQSSDLTIENKVHSVRKMFKKIRALLKLVKFKDKSDYKKENYFFKESAKKLSQVRDMHVAIENLNNFKESIKNKVLQKKINSLIHQINNSLSSINCQSLLNEIEKELNEKKESLTIEELLIVNKIKTLSVGFKKNYKLGKIKMKKSLQNNSSENIHCWRKHSKYLYLQSLLLSPLLKNSKKNFLYKVDNLSELLGKYHDLCNIEDLLLSDQFYDFNDKDKQKLFKIIQIEKMGLYNKIKKAGNKVFSESSSTFPQNKLKDFHKY